MAFNNFNYLNCFAGIIKQAEYCIENDDMDTLKELVDKFDLLGTVSVFTDYHRPEPLYNKAIRHKRDDMALLFYMANPTENKAYLHETQHNDFIFYTDILGCAVINGRYELVKNLLDLKGIYEFDIDGVKNSNNNLLNFYYTVKRGNSNYFYNGLTCDDKYISSPLLISILIGDWDMYQLLKSRGAYFNKANKDCKFHFENCTNPKIIFDLATSF